MEIKSNGTVVLKGITPINARYGYSPKVSDNGTWLVYNDIDGWVDTGIVAKGKDGLPGAPGRDGLPGRDGVDGKDGRDGYTPVKGVDYFDGAPGRDGAPGKDGVNGKDGLPGRDGIDGKDGAPGKDGLPGADGKTPVKGVDYFTEEDVIQIAEQAATMVVPYDDTELSWRVSLLETALLGVSDLIGGDG